MKSSNNAIVAALYVRIQQLRALTLFEHNLSLLQSIPSALETEKNYYT